MPIDGPCLLFGDNQRMITSITLPKSVLKKRHNANAYNQVRESVVAPIIDLVHCETPYNISNLGTKPLCPKVFQRLVHQSVGEGKFHPVKDEGEYEDRMQNGQTGSDGLTVQASDHGKLVITHPVHDRYLVEAFRDSSFRSYMSNYVGV